MIIGMVGQKGSGKDTVAAYLVKQYQFERRAFADMLKLSVAVLFDIPFHQVDQLKNGDQKSRVVQLWSEEGRITNLSFREFLQRYGTESHREVFGYDFWVNQTLPADGYYAGRNIVITDCRFENEAERIKELGGFLCKIERSTNSESTDTHISEKFDFTVDHIIDNNGTIEDLWSKIEAMLLVAGEGN